MIALLLVVLLVAFPATAVAQEPVVTPTPTPTADVEEDEDVTDPVDDEDPVEGDDAYTCGELGNDGDYTYCSAGAGSGGPPKRTTKPRPTVFTASVPSKTLPLTGASPGLVAAFGFSLLLMGVGGRLLIARSGARTPLPR